ncbi:hypothetical protein CANARDRAFT_10134 [[Candida] arabinofermentans NRRL YB-2248]|uniref:Zn(2)-C6 fungal-type domain-containing protein n=1 Tax=[Candida] arabinofermentans NRRL YB-2248 TaxID=983967 RepID=A0A1E4STK6_9ASCO|nr:hypothetical protein CANARDRAFT_10134 [[Candida] arabinofermentans NRRL YB-2248]
MAKGSMVYKGSNGSSGDDEESKVTHSNLRGKKKTRTGCLTCKRRKKKCDEIKPKCYNCTRLKLECSYDKILNWNKENQFTLNKEGLIELSKNEKQQSLITPFMVNFTKWEIGLGYLFNTTTSTSITMPTTTATIELSNFYKYDKYIDHQSVKVPSFDDFNLKNLDKSILDKIKESYLFNYYIEHISKTKTFSSCDTITNEFRSIIIPGCEKFVGLYQSILAMSSIDLMKIELRSDNPNELLVEIYYSMFIKFKNEAINKLYDILDNFDFNKIDILEELILTIMTLTAVEISNKGCKNWVNHLKEGCLIFQNLNPLIFNQSKIIQFAYRFFTLRYILLICTLKGELLSEFLNESKLPIIENFFKNDEIDHMFGCSPKLLFIIYKLITLNHARNFNLIDDLKSSEKYLIYWNELNSIQQLNIDNSIELSKCAESYLMSTKIYFCLIVWLSKLEIYNKMNFTKVYHSTIPKLISNLNDLSLSGDSHVLYPYWCMLILSVSEVVGVDGEYIRLEILKLCDRLEEYRPMHTNCQIKKAMETVWKVYDLTIEEPINLEKSEFGFFAKFDWRDILTEGDFMLPLS